MECLLYEPNLGKRTKKYMSLWHVGEFYEVPKEGRIIVAQLEEGKNIIVRVDSDLCTDEIVAWAYADDLINSCHQETKINNQEKPVSKDIEEECLKYMEKNNGVWVDSDYIEFARHFAIWQKKKDQETIEVAEDHAMLSGMVKGRREAIEKACDWLNTHDSYAKPTNILVEELRKYLEE